MVMMMVVRRPTWWTSIFTQLTFNPGWTVALTSDDVTLAAVLTLTNATTVHAVRALYARQHNQSVSKSNSNESIMSVRRTNKIIYCLIYCLCRSVVDDARKVVANGS